MIHAGVSSVVPSSSLSSCSSSSPFCSAGAPLTTSLATCAPRVCSFSSAASHPSSKRSGLSAGSAIVSASLDLFFDSRSARQARAAVVA
ncbi:hypothetical protein BDV93DRAFT_528661 [Ceratobasidium sp. AG-I]|nr:hypothetical protein BDV93DRAFT_528661 [Ceratobasidium sp. AG-I]